MTDWLGISIAVLGGSGLGAMFFAGLRWTIQKGLKAKAPGAVFAFSFIIRTALTLLGFWLLSFGRAERLLACLIGFAIMRWIYGRGVTYENQSR